jgi:hypothetical protein
MSSRRHGQERTGKYNVLPVLVYLRGRCPEPILDMTVPGNLGTRHAPVIWNVADDVASAALDALEGGRTTWGILFWVPQKFPGSVSQDVVEAINVQPSQPMLQEWLAQAVTAATIDDFVATLRR